MYTEPEIVASDDIKSRAYIKVYIDGKRYRFYNGKAIGLHCFPNNASNLKNREKLLQSLSYHLKKKLESGWKPGTEVKNITPPPVVPKATDILKAMLSDLEAQDLSPDYKRDLRLVVDAFVTFLEYQENTELRITDITCTIAEEFLKQYRHSATYYMNKRRTLGAIFSRLKNNKIITENPLVSTTKMKEKATLHKAYTRDQMKQVLDVLEQEHTNLFLCALLMYGCFLRPHKEIRRLVRDDIKDDQNVISLGGRANKGGRVRTVFIPAYVHTALQKHNVLLLDSTANIFTRCCDVYNECYFNTAWSRIKEDLVSDGVISAEHTLYSFRHTAAINLYMKTKDLYKVQQAMGHSSMAVTLTYMRSLGLVNNLDAQDAPEL
jgi:integrase